LGRFARATASRRGARRCCGGRLEAWTLRGLADLAAAGPRSKGLSLFVRAIVDRAPMELPASRMRARGERRWSGGLTVLDRVLSTACVVAQVGARIQLSDSQVPCMGPLELPPTSALPLSALPRIDGLSECKEPRHESLGLSGVLNRPYASGSARLLGFLVDQSGLLQAVRGRGSWPQEPKSVPRESTPYPRSGRLTSKGGPVERSLAANSQALPQRSSSAARSRNRTDPRCEQRPRS